MDSPRVESNMEREEGITMDRWPEVPSSVTGVFMSVMSKSLPPSETGVLTRALSLLSELELTDGQTYYTVYR